MIDTQADFLKAEIASPDKRLRLIGPEAWLAPPPTFDQQRELVRGQRPNPRLGLLLRWLLQANQSHLT